MSPARALIALLCFTGAAACSKERAETESKPEPAPTPAPAPRAATPVVGRESELPPFEKRFREADLEELARAYDSLPRFEQDLPRDRATLARPQIAMTRITGGGESFCGLSTAGAVHCWAGALDGVRMDGAFSDLAVGRDFVCAASVKGELDCAPGRSSPLSSGHDAPDAGKRTDADKYRAVSAHGDNVCALTTAGQARCWSKRSGCAIVAPPSSRFTALAVSSACFACGAKREGEIECWGASAPPSPPKLEGVTRLVAADTYVCAEQADEKLSCFGEGAPNPGKGSAPVAWTRRACWLDDTGSQRCNDPSAPRLRGELTSLALSARAVCGRDARGSVSCAGEGKLEPPVDPRQLESPTWAPTAKEREDKRTKRRQLLAELAGRFPDKALPLVLDRKASFPLGPVIESRYLPLLHDVDLEAPLSDEQAARNWRYAFRFSAPNAGTQLVLVAPGALELFAFDENAELLGREIIAARRFFDYVLNAGCVSFTANDAGNEELVESKIDARGLVEITGRRTRERKAGEASWECRTAEMARSVSLVPWRATAPSWTERTLRSAPQGCGKDWPLGAPFWLDKNAAEPDRPASAALSSCITF